MAKLIFRNALLIAVLFALAVLAGCGTGSHPADLYLANGQKLLQAGKVKQGLVEINRAIAADPKRNISYLSAMEALRSEKQYQQAGITGEAFLDAACSNKLADKLSREEITEYCSYVAESYWVCKDTSGAERVYKLGLKTKPDDPVMLNGLGYLYVDADINLKESLDLINRALKQRPDEGAFLDSLAWAQYRLEDYNSALVTMKKAMENYSGDDATLRYHLGAIYAKLNRRQEAKVELKKALILDASLKDAKDLLLKLQ